MFVSSKLSKAVSLAVAFGAVSGVTFSGSVHAQETDNVERIQVTGSSIKRTDIEGALPVQVLDRAAIDRSGLATAGDLIQSIPSMQGFTTDGDSVGGGGGGMKTASLRGLGSDYTLVLINGRRMAPRGSGSTIDLNSIPLAAIERVEVLTDGASALYGSDAIAGVVNFITKDDAQGLSVSARYNKPEEKNGTSDNFSITGGLGDFDADGYNVLISYSRDSQEQLKATDREFSKTGIIPFTLNNKQYYYVAGSPNAIPANARYVYTDATGKSVTSAVFNPYQKQNGACAADNFEAAGLCQFDYTTTVEILPENERDSLMLGADLALNDDTKLFADVMYSDFSQITRIAPNATGFFPLAADSALAQQYVIPYVDPAHLGSVTSVQAQWRALPLGGRATEWNTKSTHIVTGVEGVFDTIDYSAAFTYSKNDTDENIAGGYPIFDKFMEAVSSGLVNVFDTPDKISAEGLKALQDSQYYGNWSNDTTEVKGVDLKASTPVYSLPAGDVYVGTGVEFRNTHYVSSLADANKQDLLLGANIGSEYDLSRDNYGGFVEVIVPALENLELTGAVRYDNIGEVTSDFVYNEDGIASPGSYKVNDSMNDTTYKLALRYNVTDDLLVRASTGTGFKAPSMLDLGQPKVEFGVTSSPYSCPFAGTSDPLAEVCSPSPQQFEAFSQGNPNLKPEESEQYTLGFVYAPDNNFSFSMDYWNIELTNLVTSVTESQIVNNPVRYRDLFTTKTNKATGQEELAIIFASVNVGQSINKGIDWDLTVGNDLSFGRLTTTLAGTYVLDSKYTRPGTTDEWISSLGRFGDDNEVVFRTLAKFSNTLSHGDFTHSAILNYRSGYEDQAQYAASRTVRLGSVTGAGADVQLSVPSYVTVNYQTKYQAMEALGVTFGINNVADRAPPLSLRTGGAGHQVGFDPRYTDVYGRTFYLGLDYKFM